jgi:hypothetical protein
MEQERRTAKLQREEELKENPGLKEIESDEEFYKPPPDKIDLEKGPMRIKGKDTLKLKLEKHSEKIDDIFQSCVDIRDGASTIGDPVSGLRQITLDKIPKVMKDLAYLLGMVFPIFNDYRLKSIDKKKTRDDVVERLIFYLWKRNQKNISAKLRI